eukprot:1653674-Rhodomonas_salina.1
MLGGSVAPKGGEGRWRGAGWWKKMVIGLLVAFAVMSVVTGVMWISSLELSKLGWGIFSSFLSLLLNVALCTTQFIVLLNVNDFSNDHVYVPSATAVLPCHLFSSPLDVLAASDEV